MGCGLVWEMGEARGGVAGGVAGGFVAGALLRDPGAAGWLFAGFGESVDGAAVGESSAEEGDAGGLSAPFVELARGSPLIFSPSSMMDSPTVWR